MRSIAFVALTGLCAAQDPVNDQPTTPQPAATRPAEIPGLRFSGGSLTEFADALAQTRKVNIILGKLAEEVTIPAMDLTQVSVEAALRTACRVANDRFQADLEIVKSSDASGRPVGNPIYCVRVFERKTDKPTVPRVAAPREVQVFSLHFLTTTDSGSSTNPVAASPRVNSVLTAIDTGLAMVAESMPTGQPLEKATVRFHPDSNLLFVAGSPTQLDVVQRVLARLEGDHSQAQRNRSASNEPPPAPATTARPTDPARPTNIR